MTPSEVLTIGERAWNLCRAFNIREGITRENDTLPERAAEPLPEGAVKGETITKEALQHALDEYYALRGWSSKGIPTRSKLEGLGLGYVAEELQALGKL
jgi:aldehyde:ferredoxin oxidoreductase